MVKRFGIEFNSRVWLQKGYTGNYTEYGLSAGVIHCEKQRCDKQCKYIMPHERKCNGKEM